MKKLSILGWLCAVWCALIILSTSYFAVLRNMEAIYWIVVNAAIVNVVGVMLVRVVRGKGYDRAFYLFSLVIFIAGLLAVPGAILLSIQ